MHKAKCASGAALRTPRESTVSEKVFAHAGRSEASYASCIGPSASGSLLP